MPMRFTTNVPVSLLDMIPSGYYAVSPDSETPLTFLRLSRPKTGRYKGTTKVQTLHSEQLFDQWAWDPEAWNGHDDKTGNTIWGRASLLGSMGSGIEDKILLMIVGHREAGRLFAMQIGRCHRCGKQLTDERSRYYGFGPECEKDLEAEKDEIDDEAGGTYERLKALGQIDSAAIAERYGDVIERDIEEV